MNDKIESFKKLQQAINDCKAEIPKLEEQLTCKRTEIVELEEDALKAEILQEKNWEEKKEKAKKSRELIEMIKEQIEKNKREIELLEKKKNTICNKLTEASGADSL